MTKAELLRALECVPDGAEIRTSDDMPITGVTYQRSGPDGALEITNVWLEDDPSGFVSSN